MRLCQIKKDYLYKILLEEVNIKNFNKLKDIKKSSRLKQMIFHELLDILICLV